MVKKLRKSNRHKEKGENQMIMGSDKQNELLENLRAGGREEKESE